MMFSLEVKAIIRMPRAHELKECSDLALSSPQTNDTNFRSSRRLASKKRGPKGKTQIVVLGRQCTDATALMIHPKLNEGGSP